MNTLKLIFCLCIGIIINSTTVSAHPEDHHSLRHLPSGTTFTLLKDLNVIPHRNDPRLFTLTSETPLTDPQAHQIKNEFMQTYWDYRFNRLESGVITEKICAFRLSDTSSRDRVIPAGYKFVLGELFVVDKRSIRSVIYGFKNDNNQSKVEYLFCENRYFVRISYYFKGKHVVDNLGVRFIAPYDSHDVIIGDIRIGSTHSGAFNMTFPEPDPVNFAE